MMVLKLIIFGFLAFDAFSSECTLNLIWGHGDTVTGAVKSKGIRAKYRPGLLKPEMSGKIKTQMYQEQANGRNTIPMYAK